MLALLARFLLVLGNLLLVHACYVLQFLLQSFDLLTLVHFVLLPDAYHLQDLLRGGGCLVLRPRSKDDLEEKDEYLVDLGRLQGYVEVVEGGIRVLLGLDRALLD